MRQRLSRAGWAVAGALALVLIASLARSINAGPLDPPGPVGSTMRTLGDLVPSWHTTLSSSGGCSSQRFSCVMGGAAVLDNETGLVWEKTPAFAALTDTWFNVETLCTSNTAGGRFGWRMPTAEEMLSLKDPAVFPDGLPVGHPFSGLGSATFWTATSDPSNEDNARYVSMSLVGSSEQTAWKGNSIVASVWCVRGGSGFDPQTPGDATSWSQTYSAAGSDSCNTQRFRCVLNNQAVLDRETGLVWIRDVTAAGTGDFGYALERCPKLVAGGRKGWHLPSQSEFQSVFDGNLVYPAINLPVGHPFTNVTANSGWWTTSKSLNLGGLRILSYFDGSGGADSDSGTHQIWCVRGPAAESPAP